MRKTLFRWIAVLLCAALSLPGLAACGGTKDTSAYRAKVDLLKTEVLTETTAWELGLDPAGDAGYAVFLSVCDVQTRADVFSGTGATLEEAWEAADRAAESALAKSGRSPVWMKADLVFQSEKVTYEDLCQSLSTQRPGSVRFGVSFDDDFENALIEAELNAAGAFRCGEEDAGIDKDALNEYLKSADRKKIRKLPDTCIVFRSFGWLCDEENNIYMLGSDKTNQGRRRLDIVDAGHAVEVVRSSSDYLKAQIREDGTFVYGYASGSGADLEGYNILRHAGAVWSLISSYQLTRDAALIQPIDQAVEYMLRQVVSADDQTAYLYEAQTDEIKLGGCGLAVIALTEYMEAFDTDKYLDVCRQLGNGILSLLHAEDGTYYHVLNGDFTEKEAFRTVYYDGEATFALCRLYGMTGEAVWLDAAKAAVGHFIAADYAQYCDPWVAYTMNEITKYVDDQTYYLFALENVQDHYEQLNSETSDPIHLELLMATFELYDRLVTRGAQIDGFDKAAFLQTLYSRADLLLNGYFYPEYAMYMDQPEKILGAFMVREDGFRTRIDDVQHGISGFCLYQKNYLKLLAHDLLIYIN